MRLECTNFQNLYKRNRLLKFLTYRVFVKGFIISMPLFFLSIATPIGGITLDRFFLFFSFLMMVAMSIKTPVKRNLISFTLLIMVVFVMINRLFYQSEQVPKFLLFVSCMLSFYVSFKATIKKVNLNTSIDISFLFFALISIYSLSQFIILGYVPFRFEFLDSFSFLRPVNYDHMEKINQSYLFPRISLPYPTPPQLSIVMAVYSFYYLTKVQSQKGRIYTIYLIVGVFLMVTTISRSGIIPFLLVSLMYNTFYSRKNIFIQYLRIFAIFTVMIILIRLFNEDLFTILYDRFLGSSTKEFTSGHLGARMVALNIFINGSFPEMLFGIGIGNYPDLHAHMTLLTLLVEIGLVGVFIYFLIFAQRFYTSFFYYKKFRRLAPDNLIEFMTVLLVFLGMLLYEFTYIFPLYMFMGLTCGKSFLEVRKLKLMK